MCYFFNKCKFDIKVITTVGRQHDVFVIFVLCNDLHQSLPVPFLQIVILVCKNLELKLPSRPIACTKRACVCCT